MKTYEHCLDCNTALPLSVLRSNAGYYYGTLCPNCGPHTRVSGYFQTRELAQEELDDYDEGCIDGCPCCSDDN